MTDEEIAKKITEDKLSHENHVARVMIKALVVRLERTWHQEDSLDPAIGMVTGGEMIQWLEDCGKVLAP